MRYSITFFEINGDFRESKTFPTLKSLFASFAFTEKTKQIISNTIMQEGRYLKGINYKNDGEYSFDYLNFAIDEIDEYGVTTFKETFKDPIKCSY